MRREPLSASECHSTIVVNGVAFFGPLSGACLAVSARHGLALWRTREWKYEARKADGSLVVPLLETDPMTFPSRELLGLLGRRAA